MSPEIKAFILILRSMEVQNFKDIQEGLLATLHEYQGYSNVKKIFENALKSLTLEDEAPDHPRTSEAETQTSE